MAKLISSFILACLLLLAHAQEPTVPNNEAGVSECGVGCAECDSQQVCQSCLPGYGFNYEDNCVSCPKGCANCIESEVCTTCQSGFTVTRDGLCGQTTGCTVANCTICDGSTCLQCTDRMFVDSETGQCEECGKGCISCTNDITCDVCEEGKTLFMSRCIPAPISTNCTEHCTACDGEECLVCEQGYFFDQEGLDQCIACPASCQNCLDSRTCVNCNQGTMFDDQGNCVPIPTFDEEEVPETQETSTSTSQPTPSGTTSESTLSGTTSESTPSGTTSESTPSGTSESTPSGTTSESTPSGTTSESTPSGTTSESTPSGTTSESTPSGTNNSNTGTRRLQTDTGSDMEGMEEAPITPTQNTTTAANQTNQTTTANATESNTTNMTNTTSTPTESGITPEAANTTSNTANMACNIERCTSCTADNLACATCEPGWEVSVNGQCQQSSMQPHNGMTGPGAMNGIQLILAYTSMLPLLCWLL